MAIRTQYAIYTARNFSTGLTDVVANVFKDGNNTPVATGLALTEISTIEAPGRYRLALSPTQINSFGGVGVYTITIDSPSKSAPATVKLIVEANNNDDLEAHLVIIEGKVDTLITNLSALQSDVTSVKGTVEDTNTKVSDGTFGLSALKTLIDAVQAGVTSIQNNTRTVVALPAEIITPATGSKIYKVPIRIYNTQGSLEDPDSNSVQVSLQNSSGNDRANLFTGGGTSPKAATRTGLGAYEVELTIPAGTAKEQINMLVDYTENAVALQAVRSTNIVDEIQASGLAQQITLQEVLDDTADMQPRLLDVQTEINNATYGLAALKTALDAIDALAQSTNDTVLSGTIGNQAIIDAIALKASQASVDNIASDIVNNVKGAGFDNSTDSLAAISDRVFSGGNAV